MAADGVNPSAGELLPIYRQIREGYTEGLAKRGTFQVLDLTPLRCIPASSSLSNGRACLIQFFRIRDTRFHSYVVRDRDVIGVERAADGEWTAVTLTIADAKELLAQ